MNFINKYIRKSFLFILTIGISILFVSCENMNKNIDNSNENIENKIELKDYEVKMIKEINDIRKENKLEPLIEDKDAEILSDYKINDMIDNNYFSHENLEGKHIYDVAEDMGIKSKIVGENLHYAELEINIEKYNKKQLLELVSNNYTTEDIMNEFMQSPTHKENILKEKYTGVSVSIILHENTIYVVQVFIQK